MALFAKVVVACTGFLIFRGALVTTHQAGMAVPDWPLSFGSLNPNGWWHNFPVWLEHGHRLIAATVGMLITILCAAVWRDFPALLWAGLIAGSATFLAKFTGAPKAVVTHLSIWGFAAAFGAMLLIRAARVREVRPDYGKAARWLAFAAFIGVAVQAALGGLRVTRETAGAIDIALVLRIVHACVAQLEFGLLVILATMLARPWRELLAQPLAVGSGLRVLAWATTVVILIQLIFGATMRHLGAGLVIPYFPAASPDGSWLPPVHNFAVDMNFAHTRIGALVVTILTVALVVGVLRLSAAGPRLRRPAWLALALLALQLTLGVSLIWHLKPPTPTTLHVVNGALLLATCLLLSLRLGRVAHAAAKSPASLAPASHPATPVAAT